MKKLALWLTNFVLICPPTQNSTVSLPHGCKNLVILFMMLCYDSVAQKLQQKLILNLARALNYFLMSRLAMLLICT